MNAKYLEREKEKKKKKKKETRARISSYRMAPRRYKIFDRKQIFSPTGNIIRRAVNKKGA